MSGKDGEEPKDERRRWMEGTIPAGMGTGTAVVAASMGADVATSAMAGLVANRGAALVLPGLRRRLESFMSAIRHPWEGIEDPEAEFWRRVEEREAAQEVWFVASDRLRGLLDPAACAAMGRLVRDYVQRDTMPDAFFRDVSGLLRDLEADEIDELRGLLERVLALEVKTARIRAETHPTDGGGLHIRFHQIGDEQAVRTFTSLLADRYDCSPATTRVFRLLANHGIADGGDEASSGLVYVHLQLATTSRLLSLLVVPP